MPRALDLPLQDVHGRRFLMQSDLVPLQSDLVPLQMAPEPRRVGLMGTWCNNLVPRYSMAQQPRLMLTCAQAISLLKPSRQQSCRWKVG